MKRPKRFRQAKYLNIIPCQGDEAVCCNLVLDQGITVSAFQQQIVRFCRQWRTENSLRKRFHQKIDVFEGAFRLLLDKNIVIADDGKHIDHFLEPVVVLGTGSMQNQGAEAFINNLTTRDLCILKNCDQVVCWFNPNAYLDALKKLNPEILSLYDEFFAKQPVPIRTLEAVAERYLEIALASEEKDTVLLTEGNPRIGEHPVVHLVKCCRQRHIPYRIFPAVSSLDRSLLDADLNPYTQGGRTMIVRPGDIQCVQNDCNSLVVCIGYGGYGKDKTESSLQELRMIQKHLLTIFPPSHQVTFSGINGPENVQIGDLNKLPRTWVNRNTSLLIPAQKEKSQISTQVTSHEPVIESETLRSSSSSSLAVVLTNRCDMQCEYCSRNNTDQDDEIDFEELKNTILKADHRNYKQIFITSGEPLLYSRFDELIDLLGKLGWWVHLRTNAARLDDKVLDILKVKTRGRLTIHTVLNSHIQQIHDKLRGKDSFVNTIRAIKRVKRHGVELQVDMIVTPYNFIDRNMLSRYLTILELFKVDHITIGRLVSNDPEQAKYQLTREQSGQIREVIDQLESTLIKRHAFAEDLGEETGDLDSCEICITRSGIYQCTNGAGIRTVRPADFDSLNPPVHAVESSGDLTAADFDACVHGAYGCPECARLGERT